MRGKKAASETIPDKEKLFKEMFGQKAEVGKEDRPQIAVSLKSRKKYIPKH